MVNRIKILADHFNLSPTAFADYIGVARPVISHIFSERNRPSLEVIQKIGLAFKEINLEWLLYGQGEMLKPLEKPASNLSQENAIVSEKKTDRLQSEEHLSANLSTNFQAPAADIAANNPTKKKVIKVLIFYQDNTFEEFNSCN